MKAHHFLPPVLAIIAGALWTGYQHRSLGELERESGVLQGYIDTVRNAPPSAGGAADPATRVKDGKSPLAAKKIDWKKLIGIQASRDNVAWMRASMELQRQMLEMSTTDLLAELDTIQAMDASDDDKRNIEGDLIGVLAQRDPEMVLNRFIDEIRSDHLVWQLSDAFNRWSTKDPAAATRWMDAQIEAGVFESKALDGSNNQRRMFESALVSSLLKSDPKSAEERITALPAEQRKDVFSMVTFRMGEENQKATIDVMRSTLSQDDFKDSLTSTAGNLASREGTKGMDAFLARVSPSDEERSTIISSGMRQMLSSPNGPVDLSKLDQVRSWGLSRDAGAANLLTGQSLGSSLNANGDVATLSAQAVKYAAQNGGDQVLVPFLDTGASAKNASQLLPLVDQISDPAKREEVRKKLQGMLPDAPH